MILFLNLTIPEAHGEISLRSLEAGKHVYCEKPLATNMETAYKIIGYSRQEKKLYVGCAPDTFLGGGIQTAIKLVEDGWIGRPFGATGFFLSRGPEAFHPNPEFLYKQGAGPLLDMGPYYVTMLVALFGAARKVTGFARSVHSHKTMMHPKRHGESLTVETETFINGTIEFQNDVITNLTTSFDMNFPYWESDLPFLEDFRYRRDPYTVRSEQV